MEKISKLLICYREFLNQLGAESLTHLKRLAGNVNSLSGGGMMGMQPTVEEEDEDVPELVGDFDEPSKQEGVAAAQ